MKAVELFRVGPNASLFIDQSVACFEFKGLLTIESMMDVAPRACAALAPDPPCGIVFIYAQADIQASLWDLFSVLSRLAPSGSSARIPASLVVPQSRFAEAETYCGKQNENGYMRAAFLESPPAVRWAKERAALVNAQRARLNRYP